MGVRYPCESLKGRLTLRRGVPSSDGSVADASQVLLEQEAMTGCPDSIEALQGACANGDCLRWQEFELAEAVTLAKGEVYSFVLEGFYSADMTRTARVGVSPFSENNGGHSSLVVSPVYKVSRGKGDKAHAQNLLLVRAGWGRSAAVHLTYVTSAWDF